MGLITDPDVIGTNPLLSLEEFREIMEISPWLFNQLDPTLLGSATVYKVWYEYEYQSASTIARKTITDVLFDAELMVARQLGYWPAPKALQNERIPYPKMYEASWLNGWYNEKGMLKSIKTAFGYINKIGIETVEDIETSAALVFTDSDGDGKFDRFSTAAIPTTVTDPSEIFVTFANADRVPQYIDGGERAWQVRPVQVDIVAGFVTVSGPIWLVVKPALRNAAVPVPLDPTDTAVTYVQQLKVSRLYIDTTYPGSLVYETDPSDLTTPTCTQAELSVCFEPHDQTIRGSLIPTVTQGTIPPSLNGRAPDAVKINYLSGYPRKLGGNSRMDPMHARIVARLAASLLPERAGSSNSETQIDHWRSFPTSSDKSTLFLAPQMNDSPFGQTNGGIWAWQRVMEMNERVLSGAIR